MELVTVWYIYTVCSVGVNSWQLFNSLLTAEFFSLCSLDQSHFEIDPSSLQTTNNFSTPSQNEGSLHNRQTK
jgi:hypothetical protein